MVDLLHEVESGAWKGIFTHLLRILITQGQEAIQELDKRYASDPELLHAYLITRYRAIPTFGRGTIRQFVSNASAMKQLAARDFEDLLQVSHIR